MEANEAGGDEALHRGQCGSSHGELRLVDGAIVDIKGATGESEVMRAPQRLMPFASCSPPKRRRIRGKQAVSLPTADVDQVEDVAHAQRDAATGFSGDSMGVGGVKSLANSLHATERSGPSRLDTTTCDREVPRQNRDGPNLSPPADASGTRDAGCAERRGRLLALGHAAETGRPPDAAPLLADVCPLG